MGGQSATDDIHARMQDTECLQLAAASGAIAGSSKNVTEFGNRMGRELAGVTGMRGLFRGGTNVIQATGGGYTPDNGGTATGQARHFAASAFAYARYGGPVAHLGFWYNETYRAGANPEDHNLSIRAFQMIADIVVWTPDGMGEFVEDWISTKVCAR